MLLMHNYCRTLLNRVMEMDGVTTMATLIIMGMKLLNLMKEPKKVVLLKMRSVLVFKMGRKLLDCVMLGCNQLLLLQFSGSFSKFDWGCSS